MPCLEILLLLVVGAALGWGAVWDYRARIIPDMVPACIGLAGLAAALWLPPGHFLYVPMLQRAAGCLFPAAVLILLSLKQGGVGGGDIKLLAALGFLVGLYGLIPILLTATIAGGIWSWVMKQKSIPLAVFLLPGYAVYVALTLI